MPHRSHAHHHQSQPHNPGLRDHGPHGHAHRDHHHGHHAHGHRDHAHRDHAHRDQVARGNPARGGFTFGHAGRQVRLGPVAFWTIVGTLVIMASWSIATATYFAFQDDLLTRLLARQADMQHAYEDRIADLRSQVDRLASRQLLDQEQYEQKLDHIARRQAMLEQRAAALGGADPTPTGSIRTNGRSGTGDRAALDPSAPGTAALSDTVVLRPQPEREARLESRRPRSLAGVAPKNPSGGLEGTLARLQASLDRIEGSQLTALNALEEGYEAKARRMRAVLAELGLDLGKVASRPVPTGGPFVPVRPAGDAAFEQQFGRMQTARTQFERLSRTLVAVPVRKPMSGEVETTSGFGMRLDPFVRAPAMHTGLDFRGDPGDPVRATAQGTVTQAGWNGGYGKMVEIDHGNGLSTRYAHLSVIDVETGQTVRIGQVIGKVGSTGRSTGPHLHYETRIDGDPVDPQKFLRAGLRLGGML